MSQNLDATSRLALLDSVLQSDGLVKAVPVGTINKYGKMKMPDGSWQFVKRGRKSGAGDDDQGSAGASGKQDDGGSKQPAKQDDGGAGKQGGDNVGGKAAAIINGPGTKSEKVKKLAELGMSAKQIQSQTGYSSGTVMSVMKNASGGAGKQQAAAGGDKPAAKPKQEAATPKTQSDDGGKESGKQDTKADNTLLDPPKPNINPDATIDDDDAFIAEYEKMAKNISVKDRWDQYASGIRRLAEGDVKFMMAYGTGGLGKTYTMQQVFGKSGMKEFDEDVHKPKFAGGVDDDDDDDDTTTKSDDYDYVTVSGRMTAPSLYKELYEHNGKVIVFDDIDSILKDPDCVELLKAAFDSSKSSVAYKSDKPLKSSSGEQLPKRFKFTGRAMIITNQPKEKIAQPLFSRSLPINLTMTMEETMEQIQSILPQMKVSRADGTPYTDISMDERQEVFEFIKRFRRKDGAKATPGTFPVENYNGRAIGMMLKEYRAVREDNKLNGTNVDWKPRVYNMLKSAVREKDEE